MHDRARIARRIRSELPMIESALSRALGRWDAARHEPHIADVFREAAALNVQSFYTGLERVWELVTTSVDHWGPSGEDWHIQLLRRMSLAVPDIRPAVISEATRVRLDEARRFRHVVRNVYAENLDSNLMRRMMDNLRELQPSLRLEILKFVEFLEASNTETSHEE